jgi:hypothetical protein
MQSPLRDIATGLGLGSAGISSLGLSAISAQVAKLSMINAIDDCFIIAAVICLFAVLLIPFLKQTKHETAVSQPPAAKTVTLEG